MNFIIYYLTFYLTFYFIVADTQLLSFTECYCLFMQLAVVKVLSMSIVYFELKINS